MKVLNIISYLLFIISMCFLFIGDYKYSSAVLATSFLFDSFSRDYAQAFQNIKI